MRLRFHHLLPNADLPNKSLEKNTLHASCQLLGCASSCPAALRASLSFGVGQLQKRLSVNARPIPSRFGQIPTCPAATSFALVNSSFPTLRFLDGAARSLLVRPQRRSPFRIPASMPCGSQTARPDPYYQSPLPHLDGLPVFRVHRTG